MSIGKFNPPVSFPFVIATIAPCSCNPYSECVCRPTDSKSFAYLPTQCALRTAHQQAPNFFAPKHDLLRKLNELLRTRIGGVVTLLPV